MGLRELRAKCPRTRSNDRFANSALKIRNSKLEIRNKFEIRIPKQGANSVKPSAFEFRHSNLFRTSNFEFRVLKSCFPRIYRDRSTPITFLSPVRLHMLVKS